VKGSSVRFSLRHPLITLLIIVIMWSPFSLQSIETKEEVIKQASRRVRLVVSFVVQT